MEEIRQFVDDLIEKELNVQLTFLCNEGNALLTIGELVEIFYRKGDLRKGESLRPALDILIPKILQTYKPGLSDTPVHEILERVYKACSFAGDYYALRDYIFYSYAYPTSIEWSRTNDTINVAVKDETIFRQILAERQSFFITSKKNFNKNDQPNLMELLAGSQHGNFSDPKIHSALVDINNQVEKKIKSYFSAIPEDSSIEIEEYTYAEFMTIYRSLLGTALYERNYSAANDLSGVVTYPEIDLANEFSTDIVLERKIKILRDIASSSRGTFNYIACEQKYHLFPFSFSLKDGVAAMLKQYARRNSDAFSAKFGDIMGNHLVEEVASYFLPFKNFKVLKEIPLGSYDRQLPDIDLMAISYEPSLGFHIFVSEIKNTLPAVWAMDYLKSTGKKGFIDKAQSQIEKIKKFLATEDGIGLLKHIISTAFHGLSLETLFPTGCMIVLDFMIVTSQNIGMFYPELNLTILSNDFLREFVTKSDGDVNFIKHHLCSFNEALDDSYERAYDELVLDGVTVRTEGCVLKHIIEITQHQFLSVGELEAMEAESLRTGYRFIDNHYPEFLKSQANRKNKPE